MANTLDSISIIGLRATHFEQLNTYLNDFELSGCYYGNKEQFFKRHEEIKVWLSDVISAARDNNNRIPKK